MKSLVKEPYLVNLWDFNPIVEKYCLHNENMETEEGSLAQKLTTFVIGFIIFLQCKYISLKINRKSCSHASKTWTTTNAMESKILIERKILRKIFGHAKEFDNWRGKYNELFGEAGVMTFIKPRRLRWAEHVADDDANVSWMENITELEVKVTLNSDERVA